MAELIDALRRHAETDGRRLTMSDARSAISRSELAQWVVGAAADLGSGPETIGLAGSNSLEWAVAFLAAIAAGKTIVPIPAFFSEDQCAHLVQDAGIVRIFATDEHSFGVHGLPLPVHVLSRRRETSSSTKIGDGGLIIYTSGSTGRPKGVRLASGQALWSAKALAEASSASTSDKYLSLLPLPMLLEAICGIMIPVLVGGCVHYDGEVAESVATGTAANIAAAFERELPTTSVLVPQLLALYISQLAASGKRPPESLHFVAVGGAPLPPEHAAAATKLGIPVYEGYGLSECASVVSVNRPGASRAGTAGLPLPGLKVEIDDGEIIVEGASVMDGYLHGDTVPRRWRTGDIGALDADGYLTVYGRRDNLIVTPNGRNISPEWVETMIGGDPRIGACFLGQTTEPAQLAVLLIPSSRGEDWFRAASQEDVQSLVAKACQAAPDYARPKAAYVIRRDHAAILRLLTANGRIRRSQAAIALNDKAKLSSINQNLEVI